MGDIEIGLGVSEATEDQLHIVEALLCQAEGLVIHADHADGSVHPKFVRDAFVALASIGTRHTAPCDIHLYLCDVREAVRTIREFRGHISTGRNVHMALEGVEDAEAAHRIAECATDAGLGVIPSIQTDPLTEHSLQALDALLTNHCIQSVNILTASNAVSAYDAAQAVTALHDRIVSEHRTLRLFLDRNCSPQRVRYIAQRTSIHAVVSGGFIWSSTNPVEAINSLRRAARGD